MRHLKQFRNLLGEAVDLLCRVGLRVEVYKFLDALNLSRSQRGVEAALSEFPLKRVRLLESGYLRVLRLQLRLEVLGIGLLLPLLTLARAWP